MAAQYQFGVTSFEDIHDALIAARPSLSFVLPWRTNFHSHHHGTYHAHPHFYHTRYEEARAAAHHRGSIGGVDAKAFVPAAATPSSASRPSTRQAEDGDVFETTRPLSPVREKVDRINVEADPHVQTTVTEETQSHDEISTSTERKDNIRSPTKEMRREQLETAKGDEQRRSRGKSTSQQERSKEPVAENKTTTVAIKDDDEPKTSTADETRPSPVDALAKGHADDTSNVSAEPKSQAIVDETHKTDASIASGKEAKQAPVEHVKGSEEPQPSAKMSWANLFESNAAKAETQPRNTKQTRRQAPKVTSPHQSLVDIAKDFVLSTRSKKTRARGLINKGNMCFMNCILQALIACPPFNHLLHTLSDYTEATHIFASAPILLALVRLLKDFEHRDKEDEEEHERVNDAFIPQYLFDALYKIPRFEVIKQGRQEDAEEFLGSLLDEIHEEFAREGIPVAQGETEEADDWVEIGPRSKAIQSRHHANDFISPITQIFGGRLRSTVRATGAKESVITEPFQSLQLDITPSEVNSIVDAMRLLSKPELLEDFQTAKGKVTATKETHLEKLPTILILHLKRFYFDGSKTVKMEKDISFTMELSPPQRKLSNAAQSRSDKTYRLVAAVYHHGKHAAGGHYTCDVYHQHRKQWLRIDDTAVETVGPEKVLNCAQHNGDRLPYILFYQLQST